MKVVTKELNISATEPVTLIPISDIHMGNVGCDVDKLKATVQWIKDNGAYTVLLGDQIDAIIGGDKRYENDSMHPDFLGSLDNLPYAQTAAVAKILKPIKDQILGVMGGNHEFTVKNHYSFDSTAVLADMLDAPKMTDPAFLRLRLRRTTTSVFTVDIFCTHGLALGGGRKIGGKLNNLRDLAAGFHGDIFLAGHTHQLFTVADRYIYPNQKGEVEYRTRTYVNTGSFQRTYNLDDDIDTWASRKAFMPEKTGVARIDMYLKTKADKTSIDVRSRC